MMLVKVQAWITECIQLFFIKKTRCFCLPLSFIWFIDVILRYCLLKSAPIHPNRTIHHSNYSMLWQTVPFTINYSKLFYSCEQHMNRTGSLHQCYNGISGILCLCEFIFVEGVVGKGVTVFFWDKVNNMKYLWIILLKNDFFDFPK